MRITVALAVTASLTVLSACDQISMGPSGPPQPISDAVYVLPDGDAPAITMAAWQDGGMVQSAAGMNAGKAPSHATTYSAKQANWPTGRVRVMTFEKASGGVLHPITDETLLYVLAGTARVRVGGSTVSLTAGDVVSHPSGALRNAGMAADATIITWTAPSLTGETTPTYVKGADVAEGGFGSIALKRYQFPGNSVRAVKLAAGGNTNANKAATDSLIYITGGLLTFHQNGQGFVVTEGDFVREIAGLEHFWNVTADSGFVTTSGLPLGMEQIDPDKATD